MDAQFGFDGFEALPEHTRPLSHVGRDCSVCFDSPGWCPEHSVPKPVTEANEFTSDAECIADVEVTLRDGDSFTVENVRVEHAFVDGDFLVFETMPARDARLVNIPLANIVYWESL